MFPVTYKLVPLTFEAAQTLYWLVRFWPQMFPVTYKLAPLTFEEAHMFPELVRFAPDTLPVATTLVLFRVDDTVTSFGVVNPCANVTSPAKLEVPVPWTTAFPVVTTSPKFVMVGIILIQPTIYFQVLRLVSEGIGSC